MNSAGCFVIAPDHPALPGHFPGHPVVPGVVLLDQAALRIGAALGVGGAQPHVGAIASAKFLVPVTPGQPVEVRYARQPDGSVRFTLEADGRLAASGALTIGAATIDAPAGRAGAPLP